MEVCQDALELNGHLISTDQLLFQDELRSKFLQMQSSLSGLLDLTEEEEGEVERVSCSHHMI